MIWINDTFPYNKYKGIKFETITTKEDKNFDDTNIGWQIDYSKELGMYRITRFEDGHWDGDIVFEEINKNE